MECINAFYRKNKEEVLKLLPKLHNPDTVVDSRTPLEGYRLTHHAVWNGWDDVCKLLVETYECDPTSVNSCGRSPLHIACLSGHEASAKYLLSLPSVLSRINDRDSLGCTPSHYAHHIDNLGVFEVLLETNSVNFTQEDGRGITPFELLSNYGYNALSRAADQIDWSTQLQVQSFFNVFLVGNSAVGKSTLAAALLELTRLRPTQHGRVSNVKELTAGVVPTRYKG